MCRDTELNCYLKYSSGFSEKKTNRVVAYTGLWKVIALWHSNIHWKWICIKKQRNRFDSQSIHFSFVKPPRDWFQHWVDDSAKSPCRPQGSGWGAASASRAAEASLLRNFRNYTLWPQRWETHVPERGTALTCPASPVPRGTEPWLQTTWPTTLSLATFDELPEHSHGTAVLHPYFPQNSWGTTLSQQSKTTSHHP